MGKVKSAIGLDIGSSSIKLVELKPSKKGYRLVNLGIAPLSPETIVDGAIMNSAAVLDGIKGLLTELKVKTREVVASVSGTSVIIKKINVPMMTEDELNTQIQWEAEQYIPFDINDVNVDFQILGPSDEGQMSVLLVAVKKDMINDYTGVLTESGLTPVVVDIDAFAIGNMYEINYPLAEGEVLGLVNIGSNFININVCRDGISIFTRDISTGGASYTEEIQRQLSQSFNEAEAVKKGAGVEGENTPKEVFDIIGVVSDSISAEIQRSMDFFGTTNPGVSVNRLCLCGGASRTHKLAEAVSARLGIPTELIDPFKKVECDPKIFDPKYVANLASASGVAVGLALRRQGDR
ncbi:MAG: type IV pilus assembly protein PilM [bacterium]|nr:type IV pilus assembly protein PilM [bacterium]